MTDKHLTTHEREEKIKRIEKIQSDIVEHCSHYAQDELYDALVRMIIKYGKKSFKDYFAFLRSLEYYIDIRWEIEDEL